MALQLSGFAIPAGRDASPGFKDADEEWDVHKSTGFGDLLNAEFTGAQQRAGAFNALALNETHRTEAGHAAEKFAELTFA